MSNSPLKHDSYKKTDDLEASTALALLDARLAKSTLFADSNPHIHVVPSTCQPGAAGLFSLAITCAIELAVHTGMIEKTSNYIMYSQALFFAGLGQLICAIAEYQRKNSFGFTTWLCYSGYWLSTGFVGTLYACGVFKDPHNGEVLYEPPVKGLQMSNILWGFLSLLFWLSTFATTLAVNMLFLFLGILFFLEAAAATHPNIETATGVWGILTSALSFYIGMAVLNIEVYGKTYLPLVPLKWDFLFQRSSRKLGVWGTRKDLANAEDV